MSQRNDRDEVTELLNARDATRSRRRKPHHLPEPAYHLVEPCYCVTLCARYPGRPFLREPIAEGVVRALRYYCERGYWALYAFCLMPDHLHLVARLLPRGIFSPQDADLLDDQPERGLKTLIANFKRYTTTQIAWKQGLQGKLWQRDFYDHVGRHHEDLGAQCRYVLNNPVRAGLVDDPTEYPWCGSLADWQGLE